MCVFLLAVAIYKVFSLFLFSLFSLVDKVFCAVNAKKKILQYLIRVRLCVYVLIV